MRELSRRSFKDFVKYIKPDYDMKWFHKVIAEHLDKVYEGKIKKLMIFVPPQHGKSELSTRSFPAYLLGKNPKLKLALASYNATLAEQFSGEIQRRIVSDEFRLYSLILVLVNVKVKLFVLLSFSKLLVMVVI